MSLELTTSSRLVYAGRVVSLRVDTVRLPNGRSIKREIVEHPGAVAIVAVDTGGNVILVRQFRKAVERLLLEIPAGTLDPGEPAESCARRELEEETGFRAGALERLAGFYSSPGFCTEFLHVFLASDLTAGLARPETDELIEIVRLPLARCIELIGAGEIRDAKSIVGLLSLKGRERG